MSPTKFLLLICAIGLWGCNAEKVWIAKDSRDWKSAQPAGSEVVNTLFLIGDAGKAYDGDPVLVALERQLKVHEKDAVVFLGDNLYPVGLRGEEHPDHEEDEGHLRAQVKAVVNHSGLMVFVPGNHDWEQGGKNGFENVRRAERFVEITANRGNVWMPDNGCPGPEVVHLSDDAILVVIDTQWWLHKHQKSSDQIACKASQTDDFLDLLTRILDENRDKRIVVAGHHPMYSYGAHGGKYPLHTHLFPMVMFKKNAYIPLPVLGSVAVFYRKIFGNIQDIPHRKYQKMKDALTEVFAGHPDMIFASGHDHTLQSLEVAGNHYIVSGSGSKTRYVGKGKNARFTSNKRGFVRLDYYNNGEVWSNYFTVDAEARETLAFRELLYGRD